MVKKVMDETNTGFMDHVGGLSSIPMLEVVYTEFGANGTLSRNVANINGITPSKIRKLNGV